MGKDQVSGHSPVWRWGGLPDRGLSLQAVEELLESLDLEKSSWCMGLSRVSGPYGKAVKPSLSGCLCLPCLHD